MNSNLRLLYILSGNSWLQKILDKHGDDDAVTFAKRGLTRFSIKTQVFHQPFQPLRSSIFICNHHTGPIDFLSTFPYLSEHFADMKVVANIAIQKLYPLKPVILPVYPMSEKKKNYATLIQIVKHLKKGGNILIYPAGRVAGKVNGMVEDSKWQEGCATLIREYSKCVIPVYVDAQNNNMFYLFRKLFPRLSMLYLLRSLARSKGKKINVYIGDPIDSTTFRSSDNQTILNQLRKQVYSLKNHFNYV